MSKLNKKENNRNIDELRKSIKKTQQRLTLDPRNNELKELIDVYETELISLYKIYIRGVMVRTRATWIAEEEKNTRYFFNEF